MIALLMTLALQAPLSEEVDMLRARMRDVEIEVAIMRDRLDQKAIQEAASEANDLTTADVITIVSIIAAALGGGKWAIGKVNG